MKANEKLIIVISILACSIAIAAFAMVSLAHFISTPKKTTIPVVSQLYETSFGSIDLVSSIPVNTPSTDNKTSSASAPKSNTPQQAKDLLKNTKKQSDHPWHKTSHPNNSDDAAGYYYTRFTMLYQEWYNSTNKH